MDLKLTGKVFMVAASSKGLGFAIAEALAREGAHVSMGSRTEEAITQAAAQLSSSYGVRTHGYVLDASSASSTVALSLSFPDKVALTTPFSEARSG